jgi:hypothetical protein
MGYARLDEAPVPTGVRVVLGRMAITAALAQRLGGLQEAATILAVHVLPRLVAGDWGDLSAVDRVANDQATGAGDGRILAVYLVPDAAGVPVRLYAEVTFQADEGLAGEPQTVFMLPEDH